MSVWAQSGEDVAAGPDPLGSKAGLIDQVGSQVDIATAVGNGSVSGVPTVGSAWPSPAMLTVPVGTAPGTYLLGASCTNREGPIGYFAPTAITAT
jgi:hypothetical protein